MIKEGLRFYFSSLIKNVPQDVYSVLLALFFIIVILIVVFNKSILRKGVSRLLIVEYSVIIYYITVFSRKANHVRKFDFTPFWSYERPDLFLENVMNVVVFIPVGILLGYALTNVKLWKVLVVGLLLSLPIEILQFLFKKGFAEIDDVMHNVLGCMIGYGVYALLRFLYEKFSKRRVAVL